MQNIHKVALRVIFPAIIIQKGTNTVIEEFELSQIK